MFFPHAGEKQRFEEICGEDEAWSAVQSRDGDLPFGFTAPGAKLAVLSAAEIFDLAVIGVGSAFRGRLMGKNDCIDRNRCPVFVDDGNLTFRVRPEPRKFTRMTKLGKHSEQPVRIHDRRRHETGGFVGSVTEHHPLVAGALLFAVLAVHALSDIGRLPVDVGNVFESVPAEILFRPVVTDFLHDRTRDRGGIDPAETFRGYLPHVDDDIGTDHRFAGYAGVAVELEASVEDGVGNLIRHFVGMPFRYGLRRENMAMLILLHCSFPVRLKSHDRHRACRHRLK